MTRLRSVTLDVTPLRTSRDFRLLYAGQFVSMFGSAISYVVLPVQMYQITHSPLAVGLLGVAEFVPLLALAFVGGALADYIDRRRLIVFSDIGLAACTIVLAINAWSAAPHSWVLYAASSVMAALGAIHRPALEALTPRLLPPEQMPAVAALTMVRFSFNQIVGPGLAGIIVSVAGAAVAYLVDAVTFVIAVATVLLMRTIPPPIQTQRPGVRTIVDAWRYARGRQELIGTYLLDIIAMFSGCRWRSSPPSRSSLPARPWGGSTR